MCHAKLPLVGLVAVLNKIMNSVGAQRTYLLAKGFLAFSATFVKWGYIF